MSTSDNNSPPRIGLFPGTFDPITNGHLDVAERAAKLFDRVIVAVVFNPDKRALFSQAERKRQAVAALKGLANVEVTTFKGLLVEFAKAQNAQAIIRGLRAVSDLGLG